MELGINDRSREGVERGVESERSEQRVMRDERFRMNEMEDPGRVKKKRSEVRRLLPSLLPFPLPHPSFLVALRELHSIDFFLLQSVECCLDKRAIEREPFSCSGVYFVLVKEGGGEDGDF